MNTFINTLFSHAPSSVKPKKNLLFTAAAALALSVSVSSHAADSATKVTFADNSYCGSFAGDLYDGKRFRLWLMPDQNLVINNVGDDDINVAYVNGPSGRLESDNYGSSHSYFTTKKGNHYVMIYGSSRYSSVEFCAY